jgi:hypothetical protein
MKLTSRNELKFMAIIQSCATFANSATATESDADVPKTKIGYGALFVTTEAIILTTNFHFLCDNISDKMFNNEVTLTQPMNNLVQLENLTTKSFTLIFMDELENTIEKWRFVFESKSCIRSTLDTIDAIWQKIFSVPLLNEEDEQILS